MKPRARADEILVEKLDDEVLVFDQRTGQCHVLNRTAAAVWHRCDGRSGLPELASAIADVSELPAREEIATLALDELRRARLVEDASARGLSRRALIRRLGLVAGLTALLPAVESIVAPQPADAQSGPVTTLVAT
jgi:PqqD family protein of HPr-rel-A system